MSQLSAQLNKVIDKTGKLIRHAVAGGERPAETGERNA